MNKYVHQLFSKVVFETKLDYTKKDLDKLVKEFKKFNIKDTGEQSNITKATNSKYVLNNVKFKSLKKDLLKQFYRFKDNVLKYENTDFDITTSWLALSNSENEGVSHNHRNSFYSGVYYLKVPEKSGGISFIDYNSQNFYITPTVENSYNSTEWAFDVKEDLLLFFPSETYHTILKNHSKDERISLSFNLVPNGKFGLNDSELIINR
jgi:uncharacterized protein (TIGR02466 family)